MKLITESDLKLLSHRQQVQFAIFCAKQVEFTWKYEPTCVDAIATVEAWLEGKATMKECRKAATAANAAYAAAYAAYAAAYAANAAADAADAAAYKPSYRAAQWKYFYELLGELGKILYF